MFRLILKTNDRAEKKSEVFNPAKIMYGTKNIVSSAGVGVGVGVGAGAEAGIAVDDSYPSTTQGAHPTIAARLREFSDSPVPETLLKASSIHPNHLQYYKNLPTELSKLNHLILYGPSGVGKEYNARYIISKYSPTKLIAERKIMMAPDTKNEFWTKSSDIHYEIDFQHLGCRAVSAWHDFFEHVRDITLTKPMRTSIILIKNFHIIPYELLSVFYSYIHRCNRSCCIRIIGLSETVSHLPDDLLDIFEVIPFERPSKAIYKKAITEAATEVCLPSNIYNIRRVKLTHKTKNTEKMERNYFTHVADKLAESIITSMFAPSLDIHLIREQLYQIPIQLLEVETVLWLILWKLRERSVLNELQLETVWEWYYEYAHHHNHHYRFIYHIEHIIMRLITLMRG
jgi:hypothetical protein